MFERGRGVEHGSLDLLTRHGEVQVFAIDSEGFLRQSSVRDESMSEAPSHNHDLVTTAR